MIRAFLSFLETRGAGEVRESDLREALAADGNAGRAALVAEGVIRAGSRATTHPCDGLTCAREVRELPRAPDGSRRFLAVCTLYPRECETLQLGESDLAEEVISLGALFVAVRRALRIEPPLGVPASTSRGGAFTGADEPVLLGEQVNDAEARDVFFVGRPGAPAFRLLLAERQTTARASLILVPTARGIDPEILARHGRGHVEVGALSDLLTVQNNKIAASRQLRAVPATPESSKLRENDPRGARALDRLPRARRWGEVAFYLVDDEATVGVEIDRRRQRFTAADLGLAAGRSREPVRAFHLLRRICEGNGAFDTRPWGERENGKQIVSELRKGLSVAFEIAESPIEAYSRSTKSWKTKFRAFSSSEWIQAERPRGGGRGS